MPKQALTVKLVVLGMRLLDDKVMEVRLGPTSTDPGNSFAIQLPLDQVSFYSVGSTILSSTV